MDKIFKIVLLISLLSLTVCKAQQTKLSIDVAISPSQNITDVFEIYKVIPLETNVQGLIRHIYSLKIRNDSIYILSGKNLFLFDGKGKFINQINKIGKGPEEMMLPSDFDFYGNEVVLLDNATNTLFYYSSKGKFIRREKVNLQYVSNFNVLPKGNFIFYSYNTPQGNNRFNVYFLNNHLNVVAKQLPFDKSLEWLKVLDFNQLSTNAGHHYIHLPYNNNVYRCQENTLVPYLKIDFMKHEIPADFFLKFNSSNYLDFGKSIQRMKYAELINFQEFSKQYAAIYNFETTPWIYIISKTTGRHKAYKPDRLDFLSCLEPRFFLNGYVIAIAEPGELKDKLRSTLPSIRSQRKGSFDYWSKIASKLDESDNPVLVFLKIKDL